MERKLKHWFKDGKHCSAEVLGSVTISFETTGENRQQNTSFWNFLEQWGLRGAVEDTHKEDTNGVPMLVMTGQSLVPEPWTADTKEEAFQLFVKRVAEDNNVEI